MAKKIRVFKRPGANVYTFKKTWRGVTYALSTGETEKKQAEIVAQQWVNELLYTKKAPKPPLSGIYAPNKEPNNPKLSELWEIFEKQGYGPSLKAKKEYWWALKSICGENCRIEKLKDKLKEYKRNNPATFATHHRIRLAKSMFSKECIDLYEDHGYSMDRVHAFLAVPNVKYERKLKETTENPWEIYQKILKFGKGDYSTGIPEFDGNRQVIYRAAFLGITTGLRSSEIIKARLNWVQYLYLGGVEGWFITPRCAKNAKQIPIPVDEFIIKELGIGERVGDLPIIEGSNVPKLVQRILPRFLLHIGVCANKIYEKGEKRRPVHELRSYYSKMLASHLTPHEIQGMMRHSSLQVTSSHYVGVVRKEIKPSEIFASRNTA